MEASIWSGQNTGDLVALSGRPGERDLFANWMANTFITAFHRFVGRWIFPQYQNDEETGFTEYNDAKIMAFLTTVVTLLSSMVPVTSTIVLYAVKGMRLRLAMIALFMILFSFILAIFTSARRVEIFAATAAYVRLRRQPSFLCVFNRRCWSLSYNPLS